jgi:hypothetical protein
VLARVSSNLPVPSPDYRPVASNGRMNGEYRIRKDLKGSLYGLIEVLSRNLHEEIEENQEKY